MKIIHRTDLSRNDDMGHISESVNIIEEFGIYTIFGVRYQDYAPYFRDVYTRGCSTNLEEAKALYGLAGGKWKAFNC